ncbi:Cytochrome c biogenesis protein CcsA, partial [Bienertia sinuspersici]
QNCAKCYFYPSICYVGPLNSNASTCNINSCSPISMVNDACKYDSIGLCGSLCRSLLSITLIIIIFQKDIIRIINKRKHLSNESFFFSEIQYMNKKTILILYKILRPLLLEIITVIFKEQYRPIRHG